MTPAPPEAVVRSGLGHSGLSLEPCTRRALTTGAVVIAPPCARIHATPTPAKSFLNEETLRSACPHFHYFLRLLGFREGQPERAGESRPRCSGQTGSPLVPALDPRLRRDMHAYAPRPLAWDPHREESGQSSPGSPVPSKVPARGGNTEAVCAAQDERPEDLACHSSASQSQGHGFASDWGFGSRPRAGASPQVHTQDRVAAGKRAGSRRPGFPPSLFWRFSSGGTSLSHV